MSIPTRKKREEEFHDNIFESGERKVTQKYYISASQAKAYYNDLACESAKNQYTLEYGYGPGSAAFMLAKSGGKVVAIDISEVALEQARQKAIEENLDIGFKKMDAESLQFESNSFGLIC